MSQTGPVLYLDMDAGSIEGTLLKDRSGYRNNGTVSGATPTSSGKINGALSFNGIDDYVQVSDSASLRPAQFTVSSWIKINAYPAVLGSILRKECVPSWRNNYAFSLDATKLNAVSCDNVGNSVIVSKVLNVGQWYFVTLTYNGSVLTLYVDGTYVGVSAAFTLYVYTTSNLLIGSYFTAGVDRYPFGGIIDEVRIWSRALSASEIKSEFIKSEKQVGRLAG